MIFDTQGQGGTLVCVRDPQRRKQCLPAMQCRSSLHCEVMYICLYSTSHYYKYSPMNERRMSDAYHLCIITRRTWIDRPGSPGPLSFHLSRHHSSLPPALPDTVPPLTSLRARLRKSIPAKTEISIHSHSISTR